MSAVLSTEPRPTIVAEIPETVPVKVGEARSALRSRAVCCAVETGFAVSAVLLTEPSPTMVAVIPETVPVNVGEAIFAFRSSAVVTKAVVANCVVLVAAAAVGAAGVPVNVGEANETIAE